MCVAAIAWAAHPRWRLVVAANRDESHARPTAPLHTWDNGIIAGRDLQSGGTWLGVQPQGRCALVTNYRVPGFHRPDRQSRGQLVTDLLSDADPLRIATASYDPFNLFWADAGAAHILTNQPADIRVAILPGIRGLANGAYDQPWPKTVQLCGAMADWLAGPALHVSALFPALSDATPLPEIGAEGPFPEGRYSSVFVRDPVYGTRCSTVLAIDHVGRGIIVERSFDAAAQRTGEVAIEFG